VTDPNWLLSSTAQAAAALVAIVGGFLVSRLVSLSSERGQMLRRREELGTRQRLKAAEYDGLHGQRLAGSTDTFIRWNLKDVVEGYGDVEARSLVNSVPRGSSEDEMVPVAEWLVSTTQQAFREIQDRFSGTLFPRGDTEFLKENGVDIPEGSEEIYAKVADTIAERRRRASGIPFMVSPLPSEIFLPSSNLQIQRQDALIEREEAAHADLRAIDAEIALVDEQIRSVAAPEGIGGTVIALAYLAVVGIIFPTVLMAWRPVPDGAGWRVIVVCAFVSGLVVLLIHLITRVRALRSDPPEHTK
jgi:hypothetical protein